VSPSTGPSRHPREGPSYSPRKGIGHLLALDTQSAGRLFQQPRALWATRSPERDGDEWLPPGNHPLQSFARDYSSTHQSSMFHMSDEVDGFL
jgi:hypothetical protein